MVFFSLNIFNSRIFFLPALPDPISVNQLSQGQSSL